MIAILYFSLIHPSSSFKVLTSPWPPLVNCVPGSTSIQEASGYYIDLIKKINATLLLPLDFECDTFENMISRLESNSDPSLFGAGCISINKNRLKTMKFSTPNYDSSIIILTKKSVLSLFWLIFLPFDATLWGFLFFLGVIHAHMIWIAEQSEKGPVETKYSRGILKCLQHSYMSLFLMGDLKLKTVPGRLVQICYWFTGLIILGAYLANMAAILSIDWQLSDIESFESLKGKKVGVFEEFKEEINQYTSEKKTYTWSYEQSVEMVKDLKSGLISAAALPYPFALYLSKSDCDYIIVGQRFIIDYFAFAFPQNFNDTAYRLITKVNLDLYTRHYHRNLENKFVLVTDTGTCDYSADIPLNFNSIGGIWLVIGLECIAGLIIALLIKFKKKNDEEVDSIKPTKKSIDLKEAAEIDLISKFEKILRSSEQKMIQKIKDYQYILSKSSESHYELRETLEYFSQQIKKYS